MPTTHQPATKQPSTQPPPHPLCDNFTCVVHYPLFDGVQVVADKKKGAYLVIGISGEAELLSPLAPGCRNSRVIRVQLTGWPKKGAIDDLEGKILYRIIKSYCRRRLESSYLSRTLRVDHTFHIWPHFSISITYINHIFQKQ